MSGMFSWEYVVSGDRETARATVRSALEQEQFEVVEEGTDEWKATHGTRPSFLERMTSNAHGPVTLVVKFADGTAGLTVGLHRPALSPFGGATNAPAQMAYFDKTYRATAAAVHQSLAGAGILVSSRE